ncbi:hypothetical protein AMAG_11865 [Allomyces macrogynus ATCC 38327]|uniref:Uncharacterized protein n=1 Tax=Allomyces macrogynus (strain ATCC 38327) TaxID=578462 RepID=A0A0L0SYH4_ALLM3|nr:hypothetical protein AMAG_11865 [Allomyces macrogynus ATCC 38327]|eukprot:KNE67399.1 hypothetical protein AMAG_11865 [Allomyces macrogynus ATCC 38327]
MPAAGSGPDALRVQHGNRVPSTDLPSPVSATSPRRPSFATRAKDFGAAVLAALWKNWFLVGVVVVIVLAYLFPQVGKSHGYIRSEYTVKYGAVMIIFFISGLGLKSQVLVKGLLSWRQHLIIQLVSFGAIPAICFGLSRLMALTPMDDALVAGFVVCSTMPTTISSNVIMTAAAAGNEAISLINATLGNILGIVVDFARIFIDIPITVIGPLILGQILRFTVPAIVAKITKTVNTSSISSCMLLLLVFSTFCDTFESQKHNGGAIDPGSLLTMIALIFVVIYPAFLYLCFSIGRLLKFPRPDAISIAYCGSTKTLSLGIPLIGIIYKGDPNIGMYSLPLLIYHATQLFVGGWAVARFRRWVGEGTSSEAVTDGSGRGANGCR